MSILFKPLPFPDFQHLFAVQQIDLVNGQPGATSVPDFLAYEKGADSFKALAAYRVSSFNLNIGGVAQRLEGAIVTQEFFSVLGVAPREGRTFGPQDSDYTVVVSESVWRDQFHSEPDVVGKTVLVDGISTTIVGIMPTGFWFPQPQCRLWRLTTADSYLSRADRDLRFLRVFGRLGPTGDRKRALAQLTLINERLAQAHPDLNSNLGISVIPLAEYLNRNVRPSLLALMAAVGFVLLIAAVNVANFQLMRALRRGKEFVVRLSLGASQVCIFRQILIEGVLLSMGGAAIGLLLAFFGVPLLLKLNPTFASRAVHAEIDLSTPVFTLLVSSLVAAVSAVVPILQFVTSDLLSSLNDQAGRATPGKRTRFLQHSLIVIEVSAALALLICVNLMTKSFLRLSSVQVGFKTQGLVSASIRPQESNYPKLTDVRALQTVLVSRISELPGVQTVAVTSDSPLIGGFENYFGIRGRADEDPIRREMVAQCSVSSGFFQMMGIRLRMGREFFESDSVRTQPVAIINDTMARRYWSGHNPIGSQIRHGLPEEKTRWYTVVGVAEDTVPLIGWKPLPTIFTPYSQIPEGYDDSLGRPMSLLVRSGSSNSPGLQLSLQNTAAQIDPRLRVDIRTIDEIISSSLAEPKSRTLIFAVFGGLAFWLNMIGIYGVVATATANEIRDIAIRMSLGASPRDVLMLILRRATVATGIGVTLGIATALALAHFLQSFLYEISTTDVTAYLSATTGVALASLVAAYLPARQAMRVDPLTALRHK